MDGTLGELPGCFNRAGLALLWLLSWGCGAPDPLLSRTVGGQLEAGPFVPPTAYEAFVRGERAFLAGRFEEAQHAFELADASGPADPLVVARLAETLQALSKHGQADRWVARGLEAFPNSGALWLARGHIALERGQPAEAERFLSFGCRSAASPEAACLALAEQVALKNPTAGAQVLSEFGAAHGPTFQSKLAELRLRLRAGHQDAERTATLAAELAQSGPHGRDVTLALLRVLVASGKPESALAPMRALPTSLVPATLRVEVLLAAGLHDEAARALETHGADSVEDAIRLWLALGRPQQASVLAEREWLLTPNDETRLRLAEAETASAETVEGGTEVAFSAVQRLAEIPSGTPLDARAQCLLVRIVASQRLHGLARALDALFRAHAEDSADALRTRQRDRGCERPAPQTPYTAN